MTVFMAIFALVFNAMAIMFAAVAGTAKGEPSASLPLIAMGAVFLSLASALWVVVGLRMAGV